MDWYKIGPFSSNEEPELSVWNNVVDLIITPELILVVVLDFDFFILLDFVFINEFFDDEFLDFLDCLGLEDELELVQKGVGLRVVQLDEVGAGHAA